MCSDKKAKILVVDDELINRRLMEMTLADEYIVITTDNGMDAIDLAKKEQPDIVLLDIMMPDMNGFETCTIFKQEPDISHIPIIFVTALSKSGDESDGLTLGAIDYITKPVNPDLMRLRVRNHVELKLQRDTLKLQRDLLERQNDELEAVIKRIKKLEGILSICMYCKKIRNEQNAWEQLEQYITEHSDAWFSHGICPDCFEKHRPEPH